MATTKNNSKALATVDCSKFQITSVDVSTTAEDISEELDGLGSIPFDRVKWPTGGSTTFEVPNEEDEEEFETVEKITGVIAYHHPMNSRWANEFNGENEPPVCAAMDGKKGLNIETGEVIDCATCPYNQFDSNGKTSGKACKNIHRMYIIRDGNPVPLVVSLPPTSLSSLRNYIGKKLLIRGKKTTSVVTEITLKKEVSKNNMKYSKAVFKRVGDLVAGQIESIKSLTEMIKSIAQTEVIADSTDYSMPEDQSHQATTVIPQNSINNTAVVKNEVTEKKPPAQQEIKPNPPVQQNDFDFLDEDNDNPFG